MDLLIDLIMEVLNIGNGSDFDDLSGEPKLKVFGRATCFLSIRFGGNVLSRLGWVQGFAAEKYPLVELILDHERIKKAFKPPFPELTENHPDRGRIPSPAGIRMVEVMIRSLIPAALTAFGPESITLSPQKKRRPGSPVFVVTGIESPGVFRDELPTVEVF